MRTVENFQTKYGWLIWQVVRMRALLSPPTTRWLQLQYRQLLVLKTASRIWHSFSCQTNHHASKNGPLPFCRLYKGFGDASGKGVGPALQERKEAGISTRIGAWSWTEIEESSNWKEFTNCTEALEAEGIAGCLNQTLFYLFTDNSTVEFALYKGTSSSRKLWELVIRLYALQTKFSISIQVCHCSGLRMISSGGVGISRGQVNEGIMTGMPMTAYLPLQLSPLERSPDLRSWLHSWLLTKAVILKPMDWFELGHDISSCRLDRDGFHRPTFTSGTYVWQPPPNSSFCCDR
jgi:hypothetical protein